MGNSGSVGRRQQETVTRRGRDAVVRRSDVRPATGRVGQREDARNRREERMKKNADCGVCGQKREKSAPEKNAGKCCLCYWRGVLFWQDSFSCFIKIHIPEK